MDPATEQQIRADIKHLAEQEAWYRMEANMMNVPPDAKTNLLGLAQQCVAQRVELLKLLAGGGK